MNVIRVGPLLSSGVTSSIGSGRGDGDDGADSQPAETRAWMASTTITPDALALTMTTYSQSDCRSVSHARLGGRGKLGEQLVSV
jgi:hypothetical protein